MKSLVLSVCALSALLPTTEGHGRLMMPPGRSSAWRRNSTDYFHINYDDNQNYCGGFAVQHNRVNKGRCGVCGDDYSIKRPRPNERGGYFDSGNLVAEYQRGGTILAAVEITANHRGTFYFELCKMDDPKQWEQEKCFEPLMDVDTMLPFYTLPHGEADTFPVLLKIPDDALCQYCVLRWIYIAANSWGCVDDRDETTCCRGCGNKQEHFYSCADIRITESGNEGLGKWKKIDRTKTTTPRPTTTRYPSTSLTPRTTTTTTRRPRTRPPYWPPTRRPTRTTTRRPTRPTTTESPICLEYCSKMCKAHFNYYCEAKLCIKCPPYNKYIRFP